MDSAIGSRCCLVFENFQFVGPLNLLTMIGMMLCISELLKECLSRKGFDASWIKI